MTSPGFCTWPSAEAAATAADLDTLKAAAAAAEPLRKFAKETCAALGIPYVEPVGTRNDKSCSPCHPPQSVPVLATSSTTLPNLVSFR